MSVTVVLLHIVGWGGLLLLALPELSHAGGNGAVFLGFAASAYALGVRHAFDADHIVAIDNATRRLISAGRRPVSVGFWFALGHSTVVVVSVALLVVGIDAFAGNISDGGSTLRHVTGLWGAAVSGVFLILMGALNVSALRGLRTVLHGIRSGRFVESELDGHLNNRGVINKILRPVARLVDTPGKMYPVGLLFGLGLDTAASITLLVTAEFLTPNLPWYAVFILPILFTAGMALFDSADGILMNRVYHWASVGPYRKVRYNLFVTGVSVFVAFLVGGIGLMSVLTDLGMANEFLDVFAAVDLNLLGVILIGVFALIWISAALWRRFRPAPSPTALDLPVMKGNHYGTRSAAGLRPAPSSPTY